MPAQSDRHAVLFRRRHAFDGDATSDLVVAGVGDGSEHGARGFGLEAGDQQAVGAFEQRLGDGDDLLRALTLPEDDFGHPVAQRAVVVDPGEADIFVWQVLQAVQSRIHAGAALGDGGKQFTESVLFDDVSPPRLGIFHDSTGGLDAPEESGCIRAKAT